MRPLRSLSAGVVVAISLAPQIASAGGKKAAGGALPPAVVEARRLMASGDYAQACPKLADAESQSPSPVTAMTLGVCYEKAGKIASACTAYNAAAEVAGSARKKSIQAAARRSATRLEGQVSHLTIRLADGRGAGVEVRRDGEIVSDAQLGTAVALDGGGHDVEVSASGKKTWKSHVDLAATGQNATVDVPALEDDAPAVASHPAPAAAVSEDASGGASSAPTQKIAGLVVGGLGLVGIVVGSVAGLEANAKYHDALAACGNSTACSSGSDGPSLRASAGSWATVSTASFIAGGVVLASGAILWFTAPSGHAAATVGLGPAERGTGVSLVGRF